MGGKKKSVFLFCSVILCMGTPASREATGVQTVGGAGLTGPADQAV